MSRMVKLDRKRIPASPGVYFFRDDKRRVLYIGKAANLRSRIGSYFDKQPKDQRIARMLDLAKKVDFQITDSEIEALILESQLIKKYRPQFNIMLRDDKQYFYVGFTGEKFPKIFITHQPLRPKSYAPNPIFTGPFTDGTALKTALRLLRKIFPYCTCKQKHNNYCLNYHIGKCLGFCCLKNNTIAQDRFKAYEKNVRAIKNILGGKQFSLIKNLEKEMMLRGRLGRFEKAINLRTQIEKLKQVFENAKIILELKSKTTDAGISEQLKKSFKLLSPPMRIEGYDVSNIQGRFATGAMAVFASGQPDKNEYRKFKIRGGMLGDATMIMEVLVRRFRHHEWQFPDLILIDGGKAQLNAARAVVPEEIPIVALTKNAKHRGDHIFASTKKAAVPLKDLPPAVRNLILLIDAEAHRFAIKYYRRLHRKNFDK